LTQPPTLTELTSRAENNEKVFIASPQFQLDTAVVEVSIEQDVAGRSSGEVLKLTSPALSEAVADAAGGRLLLLIESDGPGVMFASANPEENPAAWPRLRLPDAPEDVVSALEDAAEAVRRVPQAPAAEVMAADAELAPAWDGWWSGPGWRGVSWQTHGEIEPYGEALMARHGGGGSDKAWYIGLLLDLRSLSEPVERARLHLATREPHGVADLTLHGASAASVEAMVQRLPAGRAGVPAEPIGMFNLKAEADAAGNAAWAIRTRGEDAATFLGSFALRDLAADATVGLESGGLTDWVNRHLGQRVLLLMEAPRGTVKLHSGHPDTAETLRPKLLLQGTVFEPGGAEPGALAPVRLPEGRIWSVMDRPRTDEDFFGRFDSAAQRWATPPRIDYTYHTGLHPVEAAAREGSYDKAADRLLDYFQQSREAPRVELPEQWRERWLDLWFDDIFAFDQQETLVEVVSVPAERTAVSVDVTAAVRADQWTFGLYGRHKGSGLVEFDAREADADDRRPRLIVYTPSGPVELTASADTTIAPGPLAEQALGDEALLQVANTGLAVGRPFDEDTRQSYLTFARPADLDVAEVRSAELRLTGRAVGGQAVEVIVTRVLPFRVDERAMTWATHQGLWYAWTGVPGGVEWGRPEGAHSQYPNWLRRQYFMVDCVAAYAHTGDERIAEQTIRLWRDFIDDSPRATQVRRALNIGIGLDLVAGLVPHLAKSPAMTGRDLTEILKYLSQQGDYLSQEAEVNVYENIGVAYMMGLYEPVFWLPELAQAADWPGVSAQRLEAIAGNVVRPDGSYVEHSFSYPYVVIGNFLDLIAADRAAGGGHLPIDLEEAVRRLAGYLMDVATPRGFPPDWGEGLPHDARVRLAEAARATQDPTLLWYTSSGERGRPPAHTSVLYPDSDVTVLRSGWDADATHVFFSAQVGGYHAHRDALAFTLHADGQDRLVDTGMTSYDRQHPHFDWQRHQTRSHNTVEINGQGHPIPAFREPHTGEMSLIRHPAFDLATGQVEAYPGYPHRRDLLLIKNGLTALLLVFDRIVPADGKRTNVYDLNWHLPPHTPPRLVGDAGVAASSGGGSVLHIFPAPADQLAASLQPGFHARPLSDTQHVRYRHEAAGPVTFGTALTWNAAATDDSVLHRHHAGLYAWQPDPQDADRKLIVALGEAASTSGDPAYAAGANLMTDGEVAALQTAHGSGSWEWLLAADASVIEYAGQAILQILPAAEAVHVAAAAEGPNSITDIQIIPEDWAGTFRLAGSRVERQWRINGEPVTAQRDGEAWRIDRPAGITGEANGGATP
jgi:hypothetical protein